jgi:hypothetical protein
LLLGQDSEFFLFDTIQKKFIPAHTYVKTKKEYKKEAEGYLPSNYFFRDGYAVEMNSRPSCCRAQLFEDVRNICRSMFQDPNFRSKSVLPPHIELRTDPLVYIDPKEIPSWPADLWELGCSPTFNAYTEGTIPIQVDPMTLPFRTCGSHFHASGNTRFEDIQMCFKIAKVCDLMIGLPATVVFGDGLEFERRTLYGRAGEFRQQHYPSDQVGFEYRVLSSRLWNHVATFSLFSGLMMYVLTESFLSKILDKWDPKIEEPLQKAINTGVGAVELLEEFEKLIPKSKEFYIKGGWKDKADLPTYFMYVTPPNNSKRRDLTAQSFLTLREKMKEFGPTPATCLPVQNYKPESIAPEAHYGWAEYATHWGA